MIVNFAGVLATALAEPLLSILKDTPLISNTTSTQKLGSEKADASGVADGIKELIDPQTRVEYTSAGPIEEATRETSRVSPSKGNRDSSVTPESAGNNIGNYTQNGE